MFFTLILENSIGEQLNLTTTANQYMTSEIDGLHPPDGTISTSTYAGMNGSYLNNAFIEKRNVVISFRMRGIDIEKRRHALYRVVKPSQYIKIYYRTAGIDVYTEGYVESCTVNNFAALTSGQISILCPDPYWYSTNSLYAYYSRITGAFHFPFPESDALSRGGMLPEATGIQCQDGTLDAPFPLGIYSRTNNISVVNSGDEVGFTIQFEALEDGVKTPTLYNADTGEYLQIRTEMQRGDVITITTKTGNKTVTLIRNGVSTNLINCLVAGSTWLMLREGENHFHVQAQKNVKFLRVTLIHTNAYLGV